MKFVIRQRDDARRLRAAVSVHTIEERLPCAAAGSRTARRAGNAPPRGRHDRARAPTVVTMPDWPYSQPWVAMPARSRMRERAPSAATSSRAAMSRRRASRTDQRAPAVRAQNDPSPQSRAARRHPASRASRPARAIRRSVLDHVRERLARLDLAVEGEEHRPHGVVELASRSPPCRGSAARSSATPLPDADGLEQPRAPPAIARGARIVRVRARPSARIGDRDRETDRPSACRSAIGERQARPKPSPPIAHQRTQSSIPAPQQSRSLWLD